MEKCLICDKEFKSKQALGIHVKKAHDILAYDYKKKFGLLRLCKKCGKELSKNCKLTGCCNICRDKTGINNPFFGKTHSKETVDKIKEVTSIASKKMWQNKDYRKKIKDTTTGLKRTPDFKKTQKKNADIQFQDPAQRKLRSEVMKRRWRDGSLTPNTRSTSNIEKDFFNEVKKISPYYIEKETIQVNGRTFTPDVLIGGRIVLEFNGDFWHGNPRKYSENSVIADGILAKEKWAKDKERVEFLEESGYQVYVVWEMDYRKNKQAVISKIDSMLNWDDNFLL